MAARSAAANYPALISCENGPHLFAALLPAWTPPVPLPSDLTHWQFLPQPGNTRGRHVRVNKFQLMQALQAGQFLQPGVRHLSEHEVQRAQVLQTGQLLEPRVRDSPRGHEP